MLKLLGNPLDTSDLLRQSSLITPEDRVLAVVMEDKVAGQVGATKVFWAYLKRPDLEDSFKKHMQLA